MSIIIVSYVIIINAIIIIIIIIMATTLILLSVRSGQVKFGKRILLRVFEKQMCSLEFFEQMFSCPVETTLSEKQYSFSIKRGNRCYTVMCDVGRGDIIARTSDPQSREP